MAAFLKATSQLLVAFLFGRPQGDSLPAGQFRNSRPPRRLWDLRRQGCSTEVPHSTAVSGRRDHRTSGPETNASRAVPKVLRELLVTGWGLEIQAPVFDRAFSGPASPLVLAQTLVLPFNTVRTSHLFLPEYSG